MRRLPSSGLALLVGVLLGGCGSSPETQQTQTSTPPPVIRQIPPRMEFETRTDTVASEKAQLDSIGDQQTRELQVRYMVQIGAFKDPHYASAVQVTARERYHMPALNDYNTALALYQIRIGFFETRDDAYAFRQRMQREFPNDYKDAWVVQLKR